MKRSTTSNDAESMNRVDRILKLQNAATHLEILMKRVSDIEEAEQKQEEEKRPGRKLSHNG